MADTEYYIDPYIGSSTGSGTLYDPWGDLQHGMNSITFPSSGVNHTRVNIKSGATATLTNDLQFTWGGSNVTRTLTMEGYGSVAGDGGRASIETSNGFIDKQNVDNMKLVNLDIVANGGHNDFIIHLDRQCAIHNCSIETDNDSDAAIYLDLYSTITNCHIKCTNTSLDTMAIDASNGSNTIVANTIIEYAGDDKVSRQYDHFNNLIIVSNAEGSGPEIGLKGRAQGNIIYKSNTTGSVTWCSGLSTANALPMQTFIGNYIEGFTGNGTALQITNGDAQSVTMLGNYYFDCANSILGSSLGGAWAHGSSSLMRTPDLLSASAITNPGSGDYSLNNTTVRDAYFSPASHGWNVYYMRHMFDDTFGGGGSSYTNVASAKFTRLE